MSVDRNRLKEIFWGALDLQADEIGPYLDRACGPDDELRGEVLSLLRHHDERDLVEHVESSLVETLLQTDLEGPVTNPDARYAELFELGVGGCGRVTSTWDRALRRRVARKELLFDGPGQKAMLLQEARLLSWLDHPGAVSVYDIDIGQAGAAYTMRLLDGKTLRQTLDDHGPLSIRQCVRILARVCETMAHAHARGVLHLDLKPANLMLLSYGQVSVLDWGVARFHDLDAYREYLRSSGEPEIPEAAAYDGVAGTRNYMPVEQAVGGLLGPATDIYAAGAILYEMLTARLPRTADEKTGGKARSSETLTPPSAYRADIPERLEVLSRQMLAEDPADRPKSFAHVLEALDDLHGVDLGIERVLQPGEVLFRQGEAGEEAFQILQGVVSVTVDGPSGPVEVATRRVGDLIGEMAVVSKAPRSATVTAVELTRVAVVTGDVISRAIQGAHPLLGRMLRSLSDRLREELERIQE